MIQLETSTTVKLRQAFLSGFSNYLPFTSYNSNMFLLKRLAGVPGYQYNVKDEVLQPQIFTDEEIKKISKEYETRISHEYRKYLTFNEKIIMIDHGIKAIMKEEEVEENSKMSQGIRNYFEKTFGDKIPSKYAVYIFDDSAVVYDDRNYQKLTFHDKIFVNIELLVVDLLKISFIRKILETLWSKVLCSMKSSLKCQNIKFE
jgi:hypothetical protein